MMKVVSTIFLIFGMIVGAGFASGNEIVVYFSRFGNMSYVYILMSAILLFLILYFFLAYGQKISQKLETNKILNLTMSLIALVFCASMYAGIDNLLLYFSPWIHSVAMVALLLLCLLITIKGLGGLEKFNLYLMPFLGVCFFIVLCFCANKESTFYLTDVKPLAGLLYSPLYVALNTSMSIFVLAKQGEKLNKKQAIWASLFSVLLLSGFLLFGNFILIRNPESFVREMPILFVVKDNFLIFICEFFVILTGCFSTLISLCFTLKNSIKKLIKNNYLTIFSSVFLPYFICNVGFSRIISLFYPICSVFGIFILLFAIFSFDKTDQIIHPKS